MALLSADVTVSHKSFHMVDTFSQHTTTSRMPRPKCG